MRTIVTSNFDALARLWKTVAGQAAAPSPNRAAERAEDALRVRSPVDVAQISQNRNRQNLPGAFGSIAVHESRPLFSRRSFFVA
jgi:hypothetical protein